jgi:hypothetical protein
MGQLYCHLGAPIYFGAPIFFAQTGANGANSKAVRRDPFTCEVFSCNLHTRGQSVQQHGEKQRNVPGHRRIISCHGIHCCVLGARLVAVGLAERARCAPEGFASGRRRSLQRSLPQRSDQSMSGRTLRYGRGRSRPSRQIPDVKRLDVRLQHRRGLVRALCQPDNHGRTMGRDRARWRGQDTRHRGFPPNLKGDKKRTFHANKRTFTNIVRRCSANEHEHTPLGVFVVRHRVRLGREPYVAIPDSNAVARIATTERY